MKRSSERAQKSDSKKKLKTTNGSLDGPITTSTITEVDIENLEASILESPKNYNDIVKLIEIFNNAKNKITIRHSASASLLKVFGKLAKKGALKKSVSGDATEQVALWLNDRYVEFKDSLYANLNGASDSKSSPALAVSALTILLKVFSVIEHKYFVPSLDYYYPKSVYIKIVSSIIFSKLPSSAYETVVDEFVQNYLLKYDDLRFYFYHELASILKNEFENEREGEISFNGISKKIISQRVISILQLITTFPSTEEEISEFFLSKPKLSKAAVKSGITPVKLSSHKGVFQKAWITALQLPQTPAQYKEILNILHQRIIPNMQKPQMLMDFLTDCYNSGGSIALLALNGLFLLMQNYNLDYPNFFQKLYTLFDNKIMHAKYRSRFFRLVDLFLSSTHLPSNICASFIKKMARLSLTAPPAAIVATIPFIYNQLKRHPVCMKMIHNPEVNNEYNDPFDNSELDPLLTNAIDSSLWELETLQSHYHPNVSALARIMSQPFRKPQYVLEDFLDHSYKTLLEAEQIRKLKTILPGLEYETFDNVFENPDTEQVGTTYMSGWTFV